MDFGWKHIWKLYGWKSFFSKKNRIFYFTLIVATLIVAFIYVFANSDDLVYALINQTIDICFEILPTLLGFSLGACALIIGFLTNKKLLSALTAKSPEDARARLEEISSVFAMNNITQAFTLLCAFLLRTCSNIYLKIDGRFTLDEHLISKINYVFFFFILFITFYSILLIIQNAINIFDFSQLFTYFSSKDDEVNN